MSGVVSLTPLELQSRFGGNPLELQVFFPQLSPKRDGSPKRVKDLLLVARSRFQEPDDRRVSEKTSRIFAPTRLNAE